jgi:L-iditol 2-dehydrogenase
VFGVGTIGLLACALAKSTGASYVVAIDINRARLDFAKAHGFASHTYCLPPVDNAKTTDEQLRRAKDHIQRALAEFGEPDGFDVIFECSGAESCIQMSCYVCHVVPSILAYLTALCSVKAACAGGKVMLVGMGSPKVMLPLAAAALREVDIFGSFRYANTYPAALALLASGKLKNIDKLVTHRFGLEDTAEAFELLARGEDDEGRVVLKVMIVA